MNERVLSKAFRKILENIQIKLCIFCLIDPLKSTPREASFYQYDILREVFYFQVLEGHLESQDEQRQLEFH